MTVTQLRGRCAALLVVSVGMGLGTRRFGDAMPEVLARYGGDVLWTVALFWMLALLWPKAGPWRLGLAAFGVSALVELSQLYRAPWIDSVRDTGIGALLLGQGFIWSDLACYAVGAGVGVVVAGIVLTEATTR